MGSHLKLIAPNTENRTVTPKRRPNADLRSREYPTDAEVERLTDAARANRWGQRDVTMILVAYRHGLSELVDLRCGTRSTSKPQPLPSAGQRRARLARTQSVAMNYGLCVAWLESRIPNRLSYLPQNVARPSPQRALLEWWSVQERRRSLASRLILTCSDMPAALLWLIRATIRGLCRLT